MVFVPDAAASADGEDYKPLMEFAIPGAPADTFGVKILEYGGRLTAPARDVEQVSAPACGRAVKPDKAEVTYEVKGSEGCYPGRSGGHAFRRPFSNCESCGSFLPPDEGETRPGPLP
jgi:hypothetical protein